MKILDREKNLEKKTPQKFNAFFSVLANKNILHYIT